MKILLFKLYDMLILVAACHNKMSCIRHVFDMPGVINSLCIVSTRQAFQTGPLSLLCFENIILNVLISYFKKKKND